MWCIVGRYRNGDLKTLLVHQARLSFYTGMGWTVLARNADVPAPPKLQPEAEQRPTLEPPDDNGANDPDEA